MVKIDFGELFGGQTKITLDKIQEMLTPPRRRILTSSWQALNEPRKEGGDWGLGLPFKCFTNAFDEVYSGRIDHIGWQEGGNHTYYTYLKNIDEEDHADIRQWINKMVGCVGIRDCIPVSFAIDFDRRDGNPNLDRTEIGSLREAAKPYDKPANNSNYRAAIDLAVKCVCFLEQVKCYDSLDAVIAIPPSKPDKDYHLASVLASRIAETWKREDLSDAVKKIRETGQIKKLPLREKLNAIEGSIKVTSKVKDKKVLLIDDIYQSGITMNYVAMLILEAGAKKVFGLACEKTCRNDDNIFE